MQRQATPIFFSAAGKCMPKKRARLKNFCINTDHLGNTRISFKDSDEDGSIDTENEIVETNDYYPYGMLWQTQDRMVGGNLGDKFRYNGKEMVDDIGLDWYDYGARNYNPELGRWMNLDPLAEEMRRHSPYNYAFDNPIFFIDPDGMKPCPNGNCDTEKPDPAVPPVSSEVEGGPFTKADAKFKDDQITISPVENATILSEKQENRVNPVTGEVKDHNGADIVDIDSSKTDGKEVVAPANGKVESVKSKDDGNGAGNRVHLRANTGEKHSFFHLKDGSISHLEKGQEIERGAKIGNIGSTGHSTGAHLHYEVRSSNGNVLNPRKANSGLRYAPKTSSARAIRNGRKNVPFASEIKGY